MKIQVAKTKVEAWGGGVLNVTCHHNIGTTTSCSKKSLKSGPPIFPYKIKMANSDEEIVHYLLYASDQPEEGPIPDSFINPINLVSS